MSDMATVLLVTGGTLLALMGLISLVMYYTRNEKEYAENDLYIDTSDGCACRCGPDCDDSRFCTCPADNKSNSEGRCGPA